MTGLLPRGIRWLAGGIAAVVLRLAVMRPFRVPHRLTATCRADLYTSQAEGGVFSGGRGIRTHGDVAATMVFKSTRGSYAPTAATWLVSIRAWLAEQDHPAYIPRSADWVARHD
jgi:hypothetical protein